ncbi:three-helix bundle dimerization domain-containing protein [Mycolicibacterium sp. Dal123E01]|uniref:three-helix bundle dimerization domain-containing protein n=1 Tax=Mycolicibacterium sp. Dal123E01 TaxID=3457578 RepID=UPI00403EEC18
MGHVSEAALIEQVVDRLSAAYPDAPRDDVAEIVVAAHNRFQHSTIREFVPLFVERRARAELSRSGSLLVWSS